MTVFWIRVVPLVLLLSYITGSQSLPDNVLGYKSDSRTLTVNQGRPSKGSSADIYLVLSEPKIEPGILSTSVEIGGEFTASKQAGTVDRLIFRDIRVNGVPIEVEDYTQGFRFRKGRPTVFPAPARGNIKPLGMARSAYLELTDHRSAWNITGTALVFGRFKKFGFTFKRVVAVELDLTVPNPLR